MTVQDIIAAFQGQVGHPPALVVRAPGRINIIGEHTDYNRGLVLPGAIDKAVFFAASPRTDGQLRCWALDLKEKAEANVHALVQGPQLWFNYMQGIVQQFQLLEFDAPGMDVVFGGNLPIGAGVSASAALECGTAFLYNEWLKAGQSRSQLAQLAQRSSHSFIGIPSGIMDQFASLHGKAGHVMLLDCNTLDYSYAKAELAGYTWILLNSKVTHNLANSAYIDRVRECGEGLALLQQLNPNVQAIFQASEEALDKLKALADETVHRRIRYVHGEHRRTMQMIEALAAGNARLAGTLLDATHDGLRDDYEVSCPEIELLIEAARRHPAITGTRIMGGGFGGCTINLVKTALADSFIEDCLADYQKASGIQGDALVVDLQDGVEILRY